MGPGPLDGVYPRGVLEGHEGVTLPGGAVHILQLSELGRGDQGVKQVQVFTVPCTGGLLVILVGQVL